MFLVLVPSLTQNLVSQSFQAVDMMSQQIAVHETQVIILSFVLVGPVADANCFEG